MMQRTEGRPGGTSVGSTLPGMTFAAPQVVEGIPVKSVKDPVPGPPPARGHAGQGVGLVHRHLTKVEASAMRSGGSIHGWPSLRQK